MFRVKTIEFDGQENVEYIFAEMDQATAELIAGLVPATGFLVHPIAMKFTVDQATTLYRAYGKIPGTDPMAELSGHVYYSLARVLERLVLDDE